MDCIFCKVVNGEMGTEFVYEDDDIAVFPDIHPSAPIHMLIVPKRHIKEFAVLEDPVLFGKLATVAQLIIKKYSLMDKGYRVVINGGGVQDVDHLHIHVRGPVSKRTTQ